MKKIQFGINDRKITTGADLYVLIFQISSLLPLPFMLMITGYPAVIGTKNILTFLAGIGFMAIPVQRLWLCLLHTGCFQANLSYILPY